jgi:hypothetical protein
MKLERISEKLAPPLVYYARILRHFLWVLLVLVIMLAVGTVGYHQATSPMTPWVDAFHNASIILSGMGPIVTEGFTHSGKIFSSIYALFSGIVFVGAMGYVLAPGLHRVLHKFHLEDK